MHPMSEVPITIEEVVTSNGSARTEEMRVRGDRLIAAVQALLREAAVRKITVKDRNGRTLLEFPLYAGFAGALLLGSWTALALIAAWFAEVSILIERDADMDAEGGTALGEAAGRAFGSVRSGAERATRAAGALAAQAADAVERMSAPRESAEPVIIEGEIVPVEQIAAEEAAEVEAGLVEAEMEAAEAAAVDAAEAEVAAAPRRCLALTKSGEQCKRTALPGSDYCSTHQA